MFRERKYLCYYAEITMLIGILEFHLSNGSQNVLSIANTRYSFSWEEPNKEELEVQLIWLPRWPGGKKGLT